MDYSSKIFRYIPSPAQFLPYDPAVSDVARKLCEIIQSADPQLRVEHIGSSSVPGCGGKGIVDLAILYPDALLTAAREALERLGFQKQGGPEPWPEDRPMRLGCIEHNGRAYRIHAHVIALDCAEHHKLIWFRDRLRRDPALRHDYEKRKQAILAAGTNDSIEYCKAKGKFIAEALKEYQSACAKT